ncbi:MAG: rod shape-determining protein MreD [Bacteroidetes bacterium]|nr:rod shape-determining protein MreD [Bacteroidota bacterium]MBP7399973.1 hypothetical protein [Chitinophagales bacterium]MBK7107725.1 rod shape-determining protein MreD [Bacteroidota bacterium]MBK8486844.1 rod shape-determining protein MreD [Bacteroidota bacterium]MBK8681258.1 rod shape-determining protein MreD [Bacteroidota bacterium]
MIVINWIARILGLVLLIAFQVLVLNNLNVGLFVHPYVFIMFILTLPFATPQWLAMILAMALGLIIDMFNNTPGMQMAACVFLAFVRPLVLKALTPVTGYENIENPSIYKLGATWFFIYTIIMVLIHHTAYFFIEIFSLRQLRFTLFNIGLSSLFSTVLILVFAFLFTPRKAFGKK